MGVAARHRDGLVIHDLLHGPQIHTATTLLRAECVHPKIVQERLGHALISLALDMYSHVLPSLQKEAATKLDHLIESLERRATGFGD